MMKESIQKGLMLIMSSSGLLGILVSVFQFMSDKQSMFSAFKSVFINKIATAILLVSIFFLVYILIVELPKKRQWKKQQRIFLEILIAAIVAFVASSYWFWRVTFEKAEYGVLGYRIEKSTKESQGFSYQLRLKLDSLFEQDNFFNHFKKEFDNDYRDDISIKSAREDFNYRFKNGLMFYGNYSSDIDVVNITFKWFDKDIVNRCPLSNDTTLRYDSCKAYYTKNADMIIAFISAFSKLHICNTRPEAIKDLEKVLYYIEADSNGHKLTDLRLVANQMIAALKSDTLELGKIQTSLKASTFPDSLSRLIEFYTTDGRVSIRGLPYLEITKLKYLGKNGDSLIAISNSDYDDNSVTINTNQKTITSVNLENKIDTIKTPSSSSINVAKHDLKGFLIKVYPALVLYKYVEPEIIVRTKD